ncbi:MAG: hypothetical protein ACE15C_20795 [Phycisphaerae bacterium]
MGDLLQQGVDWLDRMRTAHLSRTVTYQRGGESVEIAATLGATSLDVSDEAGATVRTRQTDFIVSADALVLGGVVVTPQVGDRILVPSGGKTLVFEVLALPGGEHFRPADPMGTTLRVHAKQIDEEQT